MGKEGSKGLTFLMKEGVISMESVSSGVQRRQKRVVRSLHRPSTMPWQVLTIRLLVPMPM